MDLFNILLYRLIWLFVYAEWASRTCAQELVRVLNDLFANFDKLAAVNKKFMLKNNTYYVYWLRLIKFINNRKITVFASSFWATVIIVCRVFLKLDRTTRCVV